MLGTGAGASTREEHRLAPPSFRRELTPTWLSACALLAGAPPLDPSRGLRVLDLQCRSGVQAAVLAAVHPDAEILAYDRDPAHVERARDLAVDGRARQPLGRRGHEPASAMHGAGDVDLLLLDDVVALSNEDRSAEIRDVVRRCVRPGGLVAVTYRTTSAWAEVAPLRHLARQLGVGRSGGDGTARFLEMLPRLRDGGAKFIVDRPHVRDIVDELVGGGPGVVEALLVEERSEPASLAAVSSWLAPAGACFVGSARLDDDELGRPLSELLADTQDDELREQLRDIAERPRLPDRPVPPGQGPPRRRHPPVVAPRPRTGRPRRGRATDCAPASRRRCDPADPDAMLRSSMAQGLAHPASIMPSDAAASRADRLDECLARIGAGIRVDSTIGSAVGR